VPSTHLRPLIALVAPMLILGSSVRAWAEPKAVPQPVAVDLHHLAAELDLFAEEARRTQLATAITGLAIGSSLLPAGIILLSRTDGIPKAAVVGMIVGGSAQLSSVPFGFIPTRMDGIRTKLRERMAADADSHDSHDTLHMIETDWRDAADASRTRRTYVGGTLLVAGTLTLASGLTLLLASEGVLGMERNAQYTWGGVMIGLGIPIATLGARFLLEWSPEETAWEAYRTMKADAPSLKERPTPPSVSLVPTRGGVAAFATFAF
jgi:hypothetical protein